MVEIAGNAVPRPRGEQMDDGTLKGILNAKLTNSLGYYGGKLSKARVTAMQYYMGEPFGNEMEGRSQVVSRDVAEAIDAMMPSIMKIFTSGNEVVRFDPTKEGDEAKAQQATDYVNWIWNQQNQGFLNTFSWFKDALLNRVGAIKIWWDEQEDIAKETYEGLTDQEFAVLMQDTDDQKLDIISHDEYPDPMAAMASAAGGPSAPPAGMPGQSPPSPPGAISGPMQAPGLPQGAPSGAMGAPGPQGPSPAGPAGGAPGMPVPGQAPPMPMLHDVVLRRTNKNGRTKVQPVPGEEFLMDRRAISLEETPFVCHRTKKTASDLIEMGFDPDIVNTLGEGDSSDFNLERLERFRQEDELPYRTGNNYDPAMKDIWINDCFIKVDYDGDGIAELRHIIFAGESGNFAPGATVILSNEETDDHAFAAATPIPMPHKFYGMSTADQVMDLQLIKSVLWRSTLDHTYNAIMPQLGVVDSMVNLDDLLTRKPGGIVRMKQQGAIEPIPAGEMGVDPMQAIGYIDQVREQRTGVQRFVAGPNQDVLNAYSETATGANMVENSSQERIELVARCFAEIGVKPAFKKILKLVCQHQKKAQTIRLNGKWVTIDPREWANDFDLTVSVGLGTGNRDMQLKGMSMLMNFDNQIIALQKGVSGPLLTAENVYAKLEKICEYLGLKTAGPYYTNPADHPPPPQPQAPKPQDDPKVLAAQIEAQADAQKSAADRQAEQQSTAAELAMRERLGMQEIALKRELGFAQLKLDAAKLGVDYSKIVGDHAIAAHEARRDTHLGIAEHRMNAVKTASDVVSDAMPQPGALPQGMDAPNPGPEV